jgi:hypothetical protein
MTSFNILFPIVAILLGMPVLGALIGRVWLQHGDSASSKVR